MNSIANQKQKRDASTNSNNAQVQLPKIPHVPTELIPQFLKTLQVTTKFFSKRSSDAYTINDWVKQDERGASGGSINPSDDNNNMNYHATTFAQSGDVHRSLMNRMDLATAAADQLSTTAAAEREASMKRSVHRWMEDVKRFARRKQPIGDTGNSAVGSANKDGIKERPSVPYAFFLYLWEMQQHHDRVAVRRSALFLSSLLLQKSKDCRQHLELDSQLSEWVSNVVGKGAIWKNQDHASKELPLLHREAFAAVSFLLSGGYGTMYPKIGVAAKSLRHRCSNLETKEISSTTSMPEYRRLRDIAIRYGKEEIRRVDELVEKADACLEILVPRVGVLAASTSLLQESDSKETRELSTYDDNSDDEYDIVWEDGDAPEDIGLAQTVSHRSAVEQTITAMESSGATMLRGGELEIDFAQNDCNEYQSASASDHGQIAEVRKKLEKYTHQLSERHLSRLALWLDGLRNADNLTTQVESASMVTMSSESSKLRHFLIQELSKTKQEVSRILSSASRLRIEFIMHKVEPAGSQLRKQNLGLGLGRHSSSRLSTVLRRQKKRKGGLSHHSTRIQIKCKK
jgi:hypothetical protein